MDGADFNNPFFGEQRGGQRPAFTFNLDAVQELVVIGAGRQRRVRPLLRRLRERHHEVGHERRCAARCTTTARRRPRPADLKGNGVTAPSRIFSQHQFGFTLGGPLKKDKAFYFVGLSTSRACTETKQTNRAASASISGRVGPTPRTAARSAATTAPIDRTNDAQVFLLKLDWQLSDRSNASLKYNYTNSKQDNGTFDVDSWARSANAIENGLLERVNGQLSRRSSPARSLNEFALPVRARGPPARLRRPDVPRRPAASRTPALTSAAATGSACRSSSRWTTSTTASSSRQHHVCQGQPR